MKQEIIDEKTTVIDAEHSLALAAEKAIKDYEEGKLLTTEKIIEMIKRGEFDD